MLDVGKPCTHTSAGAPGVPVRRTNTVTSAPSLASVVERHTNDVAPSRQSARISRMPPLTVVRRAPGDARHSKQYRLAMCIQDHPAKVDSLRINKEDQSVTSVGRSLEWITTANTSRDSGVAIR